MGGGLLVPLTPFGTVGTTDSVDMGCHVGIYEGNRVTKS